MSLLDLSCGISNVDCIMYDFIVPSYIPVLSLHMLLCFGFGGLFSIKSVKHWQLCDETVVYHTVSFTNYVFRSGKKTANQNKCASHVSPSLRCAWIWLSSVLLQSISLSQYCRLGLQFLKEWELKLHQCRYWPILTPNISAQTLVMAFVDALYTIVQLYTLEPYSTLSTWYFFLPYMGDNYCSIVQVCSM